MTNEPDRFLIDEILASSQIHLICGPSGAGKTTLALQIMRDWSAGLDIFGHASHPGTVYYLACNQSVALLRRHMRKLDIDPSQYPHGSLFGRHGEERTFSKAVTMALNRVDDLDLLILDGISALCPGEITKDTVVTDWWAQMIATCTEKRFGILATIRAAKSRGAEGYASPRERIIGSGSLSEMADSKFAIEPVKPQEPHNPARWLYLMTRGPEPISLPYTFTKSGLLIPQEPRVSGDPLDIWIKSQGDREMSTSEMLDAAIELGVSRTQFYLWRDEKVDLGDLVKTRHGYYKSAIVN